MSAAPVLRYRDLALGTGAPAAPGDSVTVRFRATLEDGTLVKTSECSFAVDLGEVIPGLDQGVAGMCLGGRRRIEVPAEMGYRDRGVEDLVPAGAGLIFEVELLAIDRG